MSERDDTLPDEAPKSDSPPSEAGRADSQPDPPLSEDPTSEAPVEGLPPSEASAKKFTSRFGISREMTDEEIEDLLARSWWGSLATVEEGGPYSVPVIYGWDRENFYVASRSGRKITNLKADPAVCLTVVEAEGLGEPWYSVIVLGDAELVHGFQGHVTAIKAAAAARRLKSSGLLDAAVAAHGASGSPEEAPMAPPLFLALVNFVIFAGLIGWKAGPALRKHFNNKHETIKGALEEAARLRQEAKDKLEEYGKRIADVDDEVNQVIEQIRQEAEAERKKIIADAEAEAARTKAEAEARITAEIEAAKRSLEREVVAAAALATEKLLREKTSAADQNNLFTSFLAGIDGEAPKKSTPPPAAPAAPAAGATDDGWS